MKIFGYLSLWGKNFSPAKVKSEINISFTKENEVGEIGKSGKYKSKPFDYGAARIDFETDCDGNFQLVPEWILNLLRAHKAELQRLGAEEVQIVLTVEYQNQCNLEFTPAFMKMVSDLEVPFLLTCYKENE